MNSKTYKTDWMIVAVKAANYCRKCGKRIGYGQTMYFRETVDAQGFCIRDEHRCANCAHD